MRIVSLKMNSNVYPIKNTNFHYLLLDTTILPLPKISLIFLRGQARSSFTFMFTGVGGSVIDSDYRGKVSVVFFNFPNRFIEINEGEQFFQIVFQKIITLCTP